MDTPVKAKISPLWIRDTDGYPSVSVTLVVVSFVVTTIAYIISIMGKIGPVVIRPFDVSAAGVYLIPCLTHYWARKQTDASAATTVSIASAGTAVVTADSQPLPPA